jgi:hypothetical protein
MYCEKSSKKAKRREAARRQAVSDGVTFEAAKAKEYPGKDYDFVAVFDCMHDMGDPVGAAKHIRDSLAKDGTWMIVEPFANDELKDDLNPLGRAFDGFPTLLCTPSSRSQEVGLCLGPQAGEARIRQVVTSGGFTSFRRAAETPFNIVYEDGPKPAQLPFSWVEFTSVPASGNFSCSHRVRPPRKAFTLSRS